MKDEIRVARWKAEGFRCPDHEISFVDENDAVSPITLIQMPNGTGNPPLRILNLPVANSPATSANPFPPLGNGLIAPINVFSFEVGDVSL